MKKTLFILFCLFYFNKAFSLQYQIEKIIGADTMHEMNIKGNDTKIMVIDRGFDLGHAFYNKQIITREFAPFSSVGEGDFMGLSTEINNIYKNTMRKINSLKKETEIKKIKEIVDDVNKKINWFYKKSNTFFDESDYSKLKINADEHVSVILGQISEIISLPKSITRDKEIITTLNRLVSFLNDELNFYSSSIRDKYSSKESDFREHGTHVLGIIARIAPEAMIIPVDIEVAMDSFKSLHEYAEQNHITVVSMSLGLQQLPSLCSDLIQGFTVNHIPFFKATDNEAIDYSKTEEYKEMIEKAQTPNNSNTHLFFVGYTKYSSNLFSFHLKEKISEKSAYSTEKVNFVLAPGTNIKSTLPANKFGEMTGSSMATPVAAASYALLNNYYKNQLGTNSWVESKIILETLSESCRRIDSSTENKNEYRMINLNKAINYTNQNIDNITNSSFPAS